MDAQLLDKETQVIPAAELALFLLDKEVATLIAVLPQPPEPILLSTRTVPVVYEPLPIEVVFLSVRTISITPEDEVALLDTEKVEIPVEVPPEEEEKEEEKRKWWLWGSIAAAAIIVAIMIAKRGK